MRRGAIIVIFGALTLAPAPAHADHGPSYRGEYANSFMVGRTAEGRQLSVMAGTHTDFPYHDPGSSYDQVAVRLDGEEPLVLTGRPGLRGLKIELGEETASFSFAGGKLRLELQLRSIRHEPRYEGDPAQLGDLFIEMGYEPEGESPGLVYTPYELTGLLRGSITLRGRHIRLGALHGQAEAGSLEAPTDRRFESRYDYIAAPTVASTRAPFTYVGFETRALHSGSEGSLDSYFHETGSDEMTMEGGSLSDGNPHGVPAAFGNRGKLPPGARKLAQWAVDLGPGILYRKLIRLRAASGQAVEALSETIEEDGGAGLDTTRPRVAAVRAGSKRISFRMSERALVSLKFGGRWRVLGDGRDGANSFRLRKGSRRRVLRATDEAGNRSRTVKVAVR